VKQKLANFIFYNLVCFGGVIVVVVVVLTAGFKIFVPALSHGNFHACAI